MELCSFCSQPSEKIPCQRCKRLGKEKSKADSVFFDVDNCKYVNAQELHFASAPWLVVDLHKTADLLTVQEFNNAVKGRNVKLLMLSYVGTTTQTRLHAQEQLRSMDADRRFLCFRKDDQRLVGTKGHFMEAAGFAPGTVLLDDGMVNINAVKQKRFCGVHITSADQVYRELKERLFTQ